MAICKNSPFELDNTEPHGSDNNGGGSSENDMWSLIRPELRSVSDAFVSLLSANGRSSSGDRCQWEKKQPSYSRNSSFNGFQLCTEGLGCESCDGLADSDDSSSSFSCSPPVIDEGGDALVEEEEGGDYYDDDDDDSEEGGDLPISEEDNFTAEDDGRDSPIRRQSNFSAEEDDNYVQNGGGKARREEINRTKNASPTFRKFPPPLPSISRSNASSVFMRSYKKDGRFVLQAVKVPSSKYLQAFREGGRLKMQLIRTDKELPEGDARTDSDDQNDDPVDDDDACPEPESCSDCDDLAVKKPGAELAPANDRKVEFFSRQYFVETFECFARKNYLAFVNAGILFNSECENADDDGAVSNKRGYSGALKKVKPAHVSLKSRVKPRTASGGPNIYYGWRSASQGTPEFCQETQSLQKSPSPSAWLLRYPLSVQRCAGSDNERRCHSLPKFRSKELAYRRCQEAKASSVWAHCVATST